MRRLNPVALLLMVVCCSGCSSVGNGADNRSGSRIQICKSGDKTISSAGQCLRDDAACYQISNGEWCTGERGNSCPSGATALPTGAVCPTGARCFRLSESLVCVVAPLAR